MLGHCPGLVCCGLQVIKLISQVIADFADGEISQAANLYDVNTTMEQYIDKSFYKTASLVAAACRCSAVFSDCTPEGKDSGNAVGRLRLPASGCSAGAELANTASLLLTATRPCLVNSFFLSGIQLCLVLCL